MGDKRKVTNARERAIKMYWKMAKVKCPFQTEEIVNGYLEGFIDGVAEVMQDNKWHDLRKDPEDLPKLKKGESFKTVLIYTKQYCDRLVRGSKVPEGEQMNRVYLSGKITGLTKEEYTRNFQRAEQHYTTAGFEVVNPVTIGEKLLQKKPDASYEDFMKVDLEALATCTAIALISGWEDSPGAQREKAEAERLGLEIMQLRYFN